MPYCFMYFLVSLLTSFRTEVGLYSFWFIFGEKKMYLTMQSSKIMSISSFSLHCILFKNVVLSCIFWQKDIGLVDCLRIYHYQRTFKTGLQEYKQEGRHI